MFRPCPHIPRNRRMIRFTDELLQQPPSVNGKATRSACDVMTPGDPSVPSPPDAAQFDRLIRRALSSGVSPAEPSGEMFSRIVDRCRSARAAQGLSENSAEAAPTPPNCRAWEPGLAIVQTGSHARPDRVLIASVLSALNILIEVLRVDAVCYSTASPAGPASLHDLRSI